MISGSGVGGTVGLGGAGVAIAGARVELGVGEGSRMGMPGAVALGCKSAVGVTAGVAVSAVAIFAVVGVIVGIMVGATAVTVTATVVASAGGVGVANTASPSAMSLRTVTTAACGAAPGRLAQLRSNC